MVQPEMRAGNLMARLRNFSPTCNKQKNVFLYLIEISSFIYLITDFSEKSFFLYAEKSMEWSNTIVY
jgi:hypothetical protein